MEKNKAVKLLAKISAVFCGVYIFLAVLIILFQRPLIRALINPEFSQEKLFFSAGAAVKMISAAALGGIGIMLMKNKGLKGNLYGSVIISAAGFIASAAAEIAQRLLLSDVNEIVTCVSVGHLLSWIMPCQTIASVTMIAACALDVHISGGKRSGNNGVKASLIINGIYAAAMLLMISLQKNYTGSDVFLFPAGCFIEFFIALCLIVSAVLMLNGANASTVLAAAAGPFMAGCFAEIPLDLAYTYFMSRFLKAQDIAAIGMISAYSGYASYIMLAGAAVTVSYAVIYLYDTKLNKA